MTSYLRDQFPMSCSVHMPGFSCESPYQRPMHPWLQQSISLVLFSSVFHISVVLCARVSVAVTERFDPYLLWLTFAERPLMLAGPTVRLDTCHPAQQSHITMPAENGWNTHNDVIKGKHFPRYWPFCVGNSPVTDAEVWCFLWSAPE